MAYNYNASYSGRISSIMTQIADLEKQIKNSTEGKYSDAMLQALATLKTNLSDVNKKYGLVIKSIRR